MKPLVHSLFFSIILILPAPTSAQDNSLIDDTQQVARLPYEVVVTPTITISDLRKLIVAVEDDFFEKFNELNIDDDYDVACYKEKVTMSHITTRICEPWFMIKARGDAAGEMAYNLGTTFATGPFGTAVGSQQAPMAYSAPELRKKMAEEYETLQEKMEQFTRVDFEFRSIGNALAELKARMENLRTD